MLTFSSPLTEADTLTIRLATSSGLTSAHLHHPPFFTGQMPFLLPNQQHQTYTTAMTYTTIKTTDGFRTVSVMVMVTVSVVGVVDTCYGVSQPLLKWAWSTQSWYRKVDLNLKP